MSERIDTTLRTAVERGDVPGVVAVAVDRDGLVYEGAFGTACAAEGRAMSSDSIFQIFSMTKGLTSLVALQMVDEGKLPLDGPAGEVEPDLKELTILSDDGALRPAETPVTLRHFLTHTSGFCYTFTTPGLAEALAEQGIPPATPTGEVNLRIPLSFEPGTRWHYGLGSDWAGRLVERASGMSLPDCMGVRVLEPLGMRETAFECRAGWESRLVAANRRGKEGGVTEQPLRVPPPSRSGGAGLLSSAPAYARFLRFMLGDGRWEGEQVLSPDLMAALTSDQIPGLVAGAWRTGASTLSNDVDFSEGGSAGHSLGFLYSRGGIPERYEPGTLGWAGIANCYYWIDRASGVAGAVFMALLPFADARCLAVRDAFQAAVYRQVTGSA